MKKLIIIPVCIITLMLSSCTQYRIENPDTNTTTVSHHEYVKSVWIAYYELSDIISQKDENEFYSSFDDVLKELSSLGFNTVTVQVRPFADALYNSSFFPKSKCLKGIDYDPLSIMCKAAKDNSFNIEAWINPYRISVDGSIPNDSPAYKWRNTTRVYSFKNGAYFNPASKDVIKLITNGVKELVENYDISAIHFDDYFYPTTDKTIDKKEYKKYLSNGGKMPLSDWRRDNVNTMIKSVKRAITSSNKNVRFGISPAANITDDKSKLYADVETWCKDNAYIDYICPQVYYGFKNETMPFMFTVKKWIEISSIDTYIGLPLYKLNNIDEYAGVGKNEFIERNNIINRQISYLSKLDRIKGIYVFSYSSVINNKDAIKKLKEI